MEHLYFIERNAIAIVKHTGNNNFISPSSVKTVTMFVIKEDEEFIAADTGTGIGMLEEPAYKPEFHEALAYKVIAQGYEKRPETLELAQYFKAMFEEKVRESLETANKGIDGSGYTIAGYDL
tara:strand:+ start:216 stop:581 length:366 start_codon:yes stop_codon:yes gene_type:complete